MRERKYIIPGVISILVVMVLFTGGAMISAAPESIFYTHNKTATGGVDITIEDKENNYDKLIPEKFITNTIDIENVGDKCWIRLKCDRQIAEDFLNSSWQINGNEADTEETLWQYAKDGYFYYLAPVEHGSIISFTEKVTVPTFEQVENGDDYIWIPVFNNKNVDKFNIPSPDPNDDSDIMTYVEPNNGKITSTIVAQAVQFDNFNPDFSTDNPWGDIIVEETIYHRIGDDNGN